MKVSRPIALAALAWVVACRGACVVYSKVCAVIFDVFFNFISTSRQLFQFASVH